MNNNFLHSVPVLTNAFQSAEQISVISTVLSSLMDGVMDSVQGIVIGRQIGHCFENCISFLFMLTRFQGLVKSSFGIVQGGFSYCFWFRSLETRVSDQGFNQAVVWIHSHLRLGFQLRVP